MQLSGTYNFAAAPSEVWNLLMDASAIAAWVASVVMNATSPLVHARGSRVTADRAPRTRSWWISGAIRWPATSNAASYGSRACWLSNCREA